MILGNDCFFFFRMSVFCVYLCVCTCACICVYMGYESMFMETHVCAGTHGSRERVSQWSLWGLQTRVSHWPASPKSLLSAFPTLRLQACTTMLSSFLISRRYSLIFIVIICHVLLIHQLIDICLFSLTYVFFLCVCVCALVPFLASACLPGVESLGSLVLFWGVIFKVARPVHFTLSGFLFSETVFITAQPSISAASCFCFETDFTVEPSLASIWAQLCCSASKAGLQCAQFEELF